MFLFYHKIPLGELYHSEPLGCTAVTGVCTLGAGDQHTSAQSNTVGLAQTRSAMSRVSNKR